MDLGPVAGQTADEDDGGFAIADAAEEQLPAVHVEGTSVGARCGEGLSGGVVDLDGFDAMRWLGFDLEEQRGFFSAAGSDHSDGRFGPGLERELYEVEPAAFGDRLTEDLRSRSPPA